MPEHTLPDALHPQQEAAADDLQLRGGLKGRFFADFWGSFSMACCMCRLPRYILSALARALQPRGFCCMVRGNGSPFKNF